MYSTNVKIVENDWIILTDGTKLAARFWFPENIDEVRAPVVLEYLPYRKRGGTEIRDDILYPFLAHHGYVGVRVDIRGNGESDGLMFDEYTDSELRDGCEIIEWLAKQSWSTGKIGMIGHSWGGFNDLQIPFYLQPEALKAVVSSCATDNRFLDDIHTMHGATLTDQLTWSQQMFAYSSRPPDPDIVGESWLNMWKYRLENLPFLAKNWLSHPHRDGFWKHASVCEDYSKINVAVLAVGGWYDLYTNAIFRLVENLDSPCRGIIGSWEHRYPHLTKNQPNIDFLDEVLQWFDYWLKGIENGVDKLPKLQCYLMENNPANEKFSTREGFWTTEEQWPPTNLSYQSWYFDEQNNLVDTPNTSGSFLVSTPQHTGLMAGNLCPGMRIDDELPGEQSFDDEKSIIFDSEVLQQDISILGTPKIILNLSSNQPLALVAVRLCDINEKQESARVTHQIFNLCHRDSYEFPQELVPGQNYQVEIPFCDIGYTFKKGHKIRLTIANTSWPLVFPSPLKVILTIHNEGSHLSLPIRDAKRNIVDVKVAPPNPESISNKTLRAPSNTKTITENADGQTMIIIDDDIGRFENSDSGLIHDSTAKHTYWISLNDPLSAKVEASWTIEMKRGDWHITTETLSSITTDESNFYLKDKIVAYHQDQVIYEKEKNEVVKRNLT